MGDQAVPAGHHRSAPRRGLTMFRLQRALPERYVNATPDQLAAWIGEAKAELGSRVLIVGHHYQRDEVMRWADARGDSFGLSRTAADRRDADYIVFCGVHFMAESADILTAAEPAGDPPRPQRRVLHGRHGRHRLRRRGLGVTRRGDRRRPRRARDLHEFVGRPQGLRGPPRRRGVHVLERPGRAHLGPRPRRDGSGPGGQGPVLPGPAPRPQHRLRARLGRRRHAGVEPPPRHGRPRRRGRQERHLAVVEGPLLGAPALPARARRRLPGRAPRRPRVHPPRMRPRRGRDGRRGGVDGLHHPCRRRGPGRARSSGSAPRSTS